VLVGKPKDPGIPNEFPYKDQILAEVAEERRRLFIHGGYSWIERKKGKKKRHEHGGGEDRPTIVSVIGTTGRISFDRINDVIKVYWAPR
jgi:GNL3L/Grn1 putative GTPase